MSKPAFIGIVNHTNTMGSPTVVIEPPAFVEAVRKLATPDTKWVLAIIKDTGEPETFLGAFNNAADTLKAMQEANADWLYLIQSEPYILEGESVYDERFWVGVHNSKSQFVSSFTLKAETEAELQTFADQCCKRFGQFDTVTLSVVDNDLAWAIRAAFPDEDDPQDHHYLLTEWDVADTDVLDIVEVWADEIETLLTKQGFKVKRPDNPDRG